MRGHLDVVDIYFPREIQDEITGSVPFAGKFLLNEGIRNRQRFAYVKALSGESGCQGTSGLYHVHERYVIARPYLRPVGHLQLAVRFVLQVGV